LVAGKELKTMAEQSDKSKEMRDLKTHEAAMTDRHETRHTSRPVTIEPGRSPGRVPDPDDAR
jgi:hypothetical protein